jgi:hypothetical protein
MGRAVRAGIILVLGASCTGGPGDAAARVPQVTPATWRPLAPAPTERTEVATAVVDGRIYVTGGFAPPNMTVPTVEVYDIATDSWSAGPDLPVAVNHAMSVAHRREVYVFGGYLADGPATGRAFVLRAGSWEELAPMPEPRSAGGAAVAGGLIYVVGGVGPDGVADRTLVLDPATGRWSVAAGLETPREHMGVTAHDGKIYAVGGRAGSLAGFSDLEVFDPSSGAWSSLPDLPTPRGGMAATATSNGFVVAVGGEEEGGTFEEAEAYDIAGRRWLSLPPVPTPRHGLGVAAEGTTVYAVAGGPEPGLFFSGANEAIDLSALRGV